jgi:predicted enzyme related to lactoylglutathione lyase
MFTTVWKAVIAATTTNPGNPETTSAVRRGTDARSIVPVELNTSDVRQGKDFYGQLFDWTLQDGTVVQDVVEVMGMGCRGIITHPTGATIGLCKTEM